MFILETQRLILRDIQPDDEPAWMALSEDEQYQRFYDESDCDEKNVHRIYAETISHSTV